MSTSEHLVDSEAVVNFGFVRCMKWGGDCSRTVFRSNQKSTMVRAKKAFRKLKKYD